MSNLKVVRKTKNFTTVDNAYLRSIKLSLKAKGLLTVIFSHSEKYDINISGLSASLQEGKSTVRTAIEELIENGYCKRIQKRNETGFGKWEYTFYESPELNQTLENVTLENQTSENRTQRITNLKNNQIKNKSITKVIPKETYRSFNHLEISVEKASELTEGYSKEKLDEILDKIENWKGNKKYTNLYLTAKNWLKREYGEPKQGEYVWVIGQNPKLHKGTKEEYEKAYVSYTAMGMDIKLKKS
jgi:predicted transcriptional regulator